MSENELHPFDYCENDVLLLKQQISRLRKELERSNKVAEMQSNIFQSERIQFDRDWKLVSEELEAARGETKKAEERFDRTVDYLDGGLQEQVAELGTLCREIMEAYNPYHLNQTHIGINCRGCNLLAKYHQHFPPKEKRS